MSRGLHNKGNRLRLMVIALPLVSCVSAAAADTCHYKSFNGVVNVTGVDQWTFIHTPIWAILRFSGGIASEVYIENHDPNHAIYFSGLATGTNQFNPGNGHTGEEVASGGTLHFPLAIYQSRSSPVTSIDITWEFCSDASATRSWAPKPKPAAANSASDPELVSAAKGGDIDRVIQLLQSGVSPDATDPQYGFTALMMAARTNSILLAQILLDFHADPNRKAKDGYTALLFGANCGDAGIDLVKLLLKSGADPTARQNRGFSALGIIRGGTAPQMENLLRGAGVPQ